jgi:hypothetical protein
LANPQNLSFQAQMPNEKSPSRIRQSEMILVEHESTENNSNKGPKKKKKKKAGEVEVSRFVKDFSLIQTDSSNHFKTESAQLCFDLVRTDTQQQQQQHPTKNNQNKPKQVKQP